MNKKSKISYTVFIIINILFSGILIFLDYISKNYATSNLKDAASDIVVIPNVLNLSYLQGGNEGAAWGIFSGKITLLLLITVAISVFVLLLYIHIAKLIYTKDLLAKTRIKFMILQFIFAMLLSGAIGNMIDRIFQGYVVDFLKFTFINFPIFNVADIYVVVSVVVMLIFLLFVFDEKEFDMIFKFGKGKDSTNDRDQKE